MDGHQNAEVNGIKARLDGDKVVAEESVEATVNGNEVESGKEEKGLASFSSSSSDDDESAVIYNEENEVSSMIVEEDEAAEIESKPVTEKLEEVVEVIEEDISEVVETSDEEKWYTVQEDREVVITEEAHQTIELEPVVMEPADVASDHGESAEKGTDKKLQTAEEDSFPAIANTEIPVTMADIFSSRSYQSRQGQCSRRHGGVAVACLRFSSAETDESTGPLHCLWVYVFEECLLFQYLQVSGSFSKLVFTPNYSLSLSSKLE